MLVASSCSTIRDTGFSLNAVALFQLGIVIRHARDANPDTLKDLVLPTGGDSPTAYAAENY